MAVADADRLIAEGYVARRENRPAVARARFQSAIALCRQAGCTHALAAALTGLGQIERDLKNGVEARACYEEAVALYRALDDRSAHAHAVRHLAEVLREAGDRPAAEACYSEALQLYRAGVGSSLDIANTLRGLALLHNDDPNSTETATLWQQAREIYAALNVEPGVEEADRHLLRLAR